MMMSLAGEVPSPESQDQNRRLEMNLGPQLIFCVASTGPDIPEPHVLPAPEAHG